MKSEEFITNHQQLTSNYYTSLYQEHSRWLHSWFLFRVANVADAEDLVHDVYTRLLTTDSKPNSEKARSFLVQISKGLVIDRYRRKQLEYSYHQILMQMPIVETPSEEDKALILEQLILIDTALKSLPAKVRLTFLMSRFENLTYSQIAVKLSVSVGSVRKYMLKALQECVVQLNNDH